LKASKDDIAPWLDFYQSNVKLSEFSNDLSDIELDNLRVNNNLFCSNLEILGDLRILGEVYTIDTNIILTERLSISNDGTGPALEVVQTGNADIATFLDDGKSVFVIKDGGFVGINTTTPTEFLTVNGNILVQSNIFVENNVTILDYLYCSNLVSDNTINILSGSNVNINDVFNVSDSNALLAGDLSVQGGVYITDSLTTSNIVSDGNLSIDATSISMNPLSNFSIGEGFVFDAVTKRITMNSDLTIRGNLEVGSLTIQAYEERTKILDMAYSNLNDYFEAENGLIANGAIFTPFENVFTKPTYFLDDIFLSSNLKIDPIFNVTIQARSNIEVWGGITGNPNGSNGLLMNDKTTFFEPVLMKDEIQINDSMKFFDTNSNGFWKIFTHTLDTKTCDLIFQSRNNIATAFTDEFDPNIINFTGQHRCTGKFTTKNINDIVGKIVVASGEYSDLYNKKIISINEAIPIVKLSSKEKDQRVFGVISDVETNDMIREHHIGFIKFQSKKKIKNKKYMINSVGEGGVWVCNVNGNISNGDYITSSGILGLGMKQNEHIHYNYTVAKITCDCDFDIKSKVYICEEFTHRNIKYKKAFLGCVYKC
jgi:hypothetical protein